MIDRFVCRREGHLPMLTITKTLGITIDTYITACQRCGRLYEAATARLTERGAGVSHRGAQDRHGVQPPKLLRPRSVSPERRRRG